MKQSARAKRMARQHKRMSKDSKLSLVSLMDIFTILVFFLMVNASDVQVLQNNKSVELPKSSAENAAKETLLLMVNATDLILQSKKIANVEQILAQGEDIIAPLATELAYQAKRSPAPLAIEADDGSITDAPGRAITVMGDKAIPYALLKRIMQTCAEAGYTDISLAVDSTDAQLAAEAATQEKAS